MAGDDADPSPTKRSNWLRAIQSYLKVTEETSLNLGSELQIEEIKSVLELLPNSPIKELNVEGSNLDGKMKELSELLVQTQITALHLKNCQLSANDFVHLIKTLKYTQIADLGVTFNHIELDKDATNKIILHLRMSHLTALNFGEITLPQERSALFVEAIMSTSITHLNLSGVFRSHESHTVSGSLFSSLIHTAVIISTGFPPNFLGVFRSHKSHNVIGALFSSLKHSAVKVLNLSNNNIQSADLKDLRESLRDSKLEELDLSENVMKDAGIDFLSKALEHSRVAVLNLKRNQIRGRNSLGLHVKNTQVKILDLSCNCISEIEMFSFPDFLRDSLVESLDLHYCSLDDEVAQQVIESLKFSRVTSLNLAFNCLEFPSIYKLCDLLVCGNIVSIDISSNRVDYDAICALGDCLQASKLKSIKIGRYFRYSRLDNSLALEAFLEKTKSSSLVSVDISFNHLKEEDSKNIAAKLVNSTFTHFDLSHNHLKLKVGVIMNLATCLKSTCITHLNLNKNAIGDTGAEVLANCIKETQIVELDIGENDITSCGAKALAYSLKDSKVLRLILSGNKIEIDGLEVLAEQVRHSFITVVDIMGNPGNISMLIDTVLWENRALAQRLIVTLKRITLESDDNLYFDQNIDGLDISKFLEDCLFLYASIIQRPSAMNVLLEEDKISFSRDQISWLMVEKFPQQFSDFIGRSVSAEVIEHVHFLKKVENSGLSKVVECLLLNRPLYTIDEAQGVLHPYVYPLLLKYKQPICNLAVEPQAKNKLMHYFSTKILILI